MRSFIVSKVKLLRDEIHTIASIKFSFLSSSLDLLDWISLTKWISLLKGISLAQMVRLFSVISLLNISRNVVLGGKM